MRARYTVRQHRAARPAGGARAARASGAAGDVRVQDRRGAEPAYRELEARAFRKTLEVRRGAGNFHPFLIVDNCNLTHAEMRPYAEATQVAGAALYVHTCKGEVGVGSVEEWMWTWKRPRPVDLSQLVTATKHKTCVCHR